MTVKEHFTVYQDVWWNTEKYLNGIFTFDALVLQFYVIPNFSFTIGTHETSIIRFEIPQVLARGMFFYIPFYTLDKIHSIFTSDAVGKDSKLDPYLLSNKEEFDSCLNVS